MKKNELSILIKKSKFLIGIKKEIFFILLNKNRYNDYLKTEILNYCDSNILKAVFESQIDAAENYLKKQFVGDFSEFDFDQKMFQDTNIFNQLALLYRFFAGEKHFETPICQY